MIPLDYLRVRAHSGLDDMVEDGHGQSYAQGISGKYIFIGWIIGSS